MSRSTETVCTAVNSELKTKSGEMKKIKKYFKIAQILIPALLVIICVFLLQSRRFQKNEIKELSEKLEEMERSQLELDTIREEVKQISQYSVMEYSYTSIVRISDKKTINGIEIPLTENMLIATVDGKMNIGINGDDVGFTERKDADGKVTEVRLTIPHAEIQDNYTEAESFKIYDERHNIFNPVKVADYNDKVVEAQEKEKQKVQESDMLGRADERIKYLLSAHFQALYGNSVKITCEFFEKKSE